MAKKATSKALVPVEVLDPALTADLLTVQQAGGILTTFLKSVVTFFREAKEREQQAVEYAARAQTIPVPTTAEADVTLQGLIKTANACAKDNTAYWSITASLSKLHKWTVAGRERSVEPYERAAKHLNTLHNTYVAVERERAAAEQRRLQAEADAAARATRQAELDELERVALAAETSSTNLSEREDAFVEALVAGQSSYAAAKAVGYAKPEATADRLMTTPKILDALAGRQKAQAAREQAQAVQAAPLETTLVRVEPNVRRAAGAVSRTTWRAEVTDAEAFIAAVVSGQYGIPLDVLSINQTALNTYARDARPAMARWPGVAAVSTTAVI